jgi:glycosyltransferase involved in cell wall biosynthesis
MISIIIPVYNAQGSISKCLDSVLNNDYIVDFEIIAVNDGSVDDSWQILQNYQKKYPEKIKIFNQENQGVAKTRNAGIGYSKFEYIMFVDCDDWIDFDYLQKFVDEIEIRKLDIVIGGYKRVTNDNILFNVELKNTPWSKYMTMAPWAKIYRKEFLLENKLEFLDNNIGEDVYFNLVAINLTDKVSIIDYCGYNWFFNEKSISNTKQKALGNKLNVQYLLDSSYEKLEKVGAINKEEVEFYFIRYIVWYLLFAGRKSSYAEICAEFEKTFGWLEKNFPNFSRNENISLFKPQGETLKNKIAVFAFVSLYKLNLIKIFLKIYSA